MTAMTLICSPYHYRYRQRFCTIDCQRAELGRATFFRLTGTKT